MPVVYFVSNTLPASVIFPFSMFVSEGCNANAVDTSEISMYNLYRINGWKCGVNLIFSRNLHKKQNRVKPIKNEEYISRYFNMQFICVSVST